MDQTICLFVVVWLPYVYKVVWLMHNSFKQIALVENNDREIFFC